jgi:hypothetical protein
VKGEQTLTRVRWRGPEWKEWTTPRVRYFHHVRYARSFAERQRTKGMLVEVSTCKATPWAVESGALT